MQKVFCYFFNYKDFNYTSYINFLPKIDLDRFKILTVRANKQRLQAFVASRYVLSAVLARDFNITDFEVEYSLNGRPSLTNLVFQKTLTTSIIDFNLSHSANHLVLAITEAQDKISKNKILLGVDLEEITSMANFIKIAKRFFHANEIEFILAPADKNQKLSRFYKIWGAKEAYIKSLGMRLFSMSQTPELLIDKKQLATKQANYFLYQDTLNLDSSNFCFSLVSQQNNIDFEFKEFKP